MRIFNAGLVSGLGIATLALLSGCRLCGGEFVGFCWNWRDGGLKSFQDDLEESDVRMVYDRSGIHWLTTGPTLSVVSFVLCTLETASFSFYSTMVQSSEKLSSFSDFIARALTSKSETRGRGRDRPYEYRRARRERWSFLQRGASRNRSERSLSGGMVLAETFSSPSPVETEVTVEVQCLSDSPLLSPDLETFVSNLIVPEVQPRLALLPSHAGEDADAREERKKETERLMSLRDLLAHPKNFDVGEPLGTGPPQQSIYTSGFHRSVGLVRPAYFEEDKSGTRTWLWEQIAQMLSVPVGFFYERWMGGCKGEVLKDADTIPGLVLGDLWMREAYDTVSSSWKSEHSPEDTSNSEEGKATVRYPKMAVKEGDRESSKKRRVEILPHAPFSFHMVVLQMGPQELKLQTSLRALWEDRKRVWKEAVAKGEGDPEPPKPPPGLVKSLHESFTITQTDVQIDGVMEKITPTAALLPVFNVIYALIRKGKMDYSTVADVAFTTHGSKGRIEDLASMKEANCLTFAQLVYDFYKVFYKECFFKDFPKKEHMMRNGKPSLPLRGGSPRTRTAYANCVVEQFDAAQNKIHRILRSEQKAGEIQSLPDWLAS
uniref:Uncharacterized protein n=1 Tax=Chromera velia CCMP2878 TaxID=1169474 RepID=A0A0G4G5M7_9ALVE|eukprot:Cvel_20387.t1-p1 / transcript=Cvel_20387.t1 / gene=Cvel_20387 / organism=Chromera_velia_CCMP2878 / gene_product=hypothetical protein / transcript_product=hypothetical protein / location=Cvel_scaffold1825:7355-13612(+) / protein_length=601 / sequence_SO=supercontig / SO=protein_coding / is_pseudo=false